MVRTILKVTGLTLVALVLVVAALNRYFGLRFVMDGGGTPYPQFVQTGRSQLERIERHREAQRAAAAASAPPAAVASSSTAQPVADTRPTESASSPKAEAARPAPPPPYWTDFRGPKRDGEYPGGAGPR